MDAGIRRNADTCLDADAVTQLPAGWKADYGPIIEAAIAPHRSKRGESLTIPCPICDGSFRIDVNKRGKVSGVCRPNPNGPYCINWIE